MIVEKEDLNGIGVGVNESLFAIVLEGLCAGLGGIGNDVVGDFQAVDIGLILLKTAEGAADGIGSKTEYGEEQEKRRERGPILEAADAPLRTGTREQPADGAIAEIQKDEKHRGKK